METQLTREHALDAVVRELERSGVSYCLFGGGAARLYGFDRAAFDIDFMVASDRATMLSLVGGTAIGENGVSIGDVELWCSPLALAHGGRVYPFVLDHAMRARRVMFEGVPALSREDQLVMKLILARRTAHKDDLEDARRLLARFGDALDASYVRWRAERSSAGEHVDRALRALGWRR